MAVTGTRFYQSTDRPKRTASSFQRAETRRSCCACSISRWHSRAPIVERILLVCRQDLDGKATVLSEFVVGILFRIVLPIDWAYTMSAVLVIATTSAFKVDRHGSATVAVPCV